MTSKVIYLGNLRSENVHIKSNNSYITDAPLDNNGKEEAFSPTDTKTQKTLEHTAITCPVFFSLHPEIEKNITFNCN